MRHFIKMGIPLMIAFSLCACNQNSKYDAYGNFEAETVDISAESAGKILSLKLEEGDIFKHPQLVGWIDTTLLSIQKEKIRASHEALLANESALNAQLETLKSELELVLANKERIIYMFNKGAASAQKKDEILTSERITRQKIEGIKANFLQIKAKQLELYASENELEERINHCRIDIPEKAVILNKYFQAYEFVAPGQSLFSYTNPDYLDLKVYVSETQLSQIQLGQDVSIYFDSQNPDKPEQTTGKLIWISSEAIFTPKSVETKEERQNLVYPIKIRMENKWKAKIGMPARVRFSAN